MVTKTQPKKLRVELSGADGNAFSIIARGTKALRRAGRASEIDAFTTEARSGDYDHVLQTMFKWFDVD